MNLTSSELADLIREIEIEDPIDYGDLPYDEDELRRLVCSHICEIAEQAGQLGEENRRSCCWPWRPSWCWRTWC